VDQLVYNNATYNITFYVHVLVERLINNIKGDYNNMPVMKEIDFNNNDFLQQSIYIQLVKMQHFFYGHISFEQKKNK